MKYICFFPNTNSTFWSNKIESHTGQHKAILPIPEDNRNRTQEETHFKVIRLGMIFFILFPVNDFLSESNVLFLQKQIHSTMYTKR
jgi:hypothetical protein